MDSTTFEKLLQTYENALDYYHVKQLRYNLGQYDMTKLAKLAGITFEERKEFKQRVALLVQKVCKEVAPTTEVSLDTIDKYIG